MSYKDFYSHRLNENVSENLLEGVDDPGAFKSVILVGGPGSGKSYAASLMFGIPSNMSVSAGGLKIVNSDIPLEHLLKKHKVDMDISKLQGDERERVIGSSPDSLRSKAQRVRDFQFEKYSEAGTGIMLDSTGENLTSVRSRMQHLKNAGYDVTVVFIDTPLEVAQQRNQSRPRKLPSDMVEQIHAKVQRNVQELKKELEGSDVEFVTVENGDGANIERTMQTQLGRVIRRAVSSPVKNPEGQRRIVQRRGGAITKSSQQKLGRTRRGASSPERQHSRYQEILKMRIKNPETNNMILVSTALHSPPNSQVRQVAQRFIKQQLQRKQ